MNLASTIPDFDAPVLQHARKDFPLLDADMSVGEALERIRREGVGERVIYFYAIDEEKRLVGVVPTRRLLTAPLETALREVMVRRVVAVPAKATVLDACEFFVLYKFLAFPVVDEQRRVVGIIDANLFAEEILEAGDTQDRSRSSETVPVGAEFFEALGFRLEQIRGASAWRAFRFRFPWLLVTVTGGTVSAILAGFFEATLAGSLIIAFFLTMVLGLTESVSMQTMSVTIHALRSVSVTRDWLASAFRRELATAVLLGVSCGFVVCVIAWAVAPRSARGHCYRRKHCALAGDGMRVWFGCALASASIEARPKNCRGPCHARVGRLHSAGDLLHKRVARSAMSKVSVVIPALNEEEPIAGVVRECLATGVPGEVIVVDNGSTDRTAERAREAGARVITAPRGYGRACAAGARAVSVPQWG